MFGFNSILLLIVLAGAGGGYVWYQNNEEEKARMIAEMAIKETQLALAEEARLRAEEDRMLMTQVLNDLETKFDNAQDSYGRLEKKFNKKWRFIR